MIDSQQEGRNYKKGLRSIRNKICVAKNQHYVVNIKCNNNISLSWIYCGKYMKNKYLEIIGNTHLQCSIILFYYKKYRKHTTNIIVPKNGMITLKS